LKSHWSILFSLEVFIPIKDRKINIISHGNDSAVMEHETKVHSLTYSFGIFVPVKGNFKVVINIKIKSNRAYHHCNEKHSIKHKLIAMTGFNRQLLGKHIRFPIVKRKVSNPNADKASVNDLVEGVLSKVDSAVHH